MTEEKKLKLKLGRQRRQNEKVGLVCQVDENIQIFVDAYQYILKVGDKSNQIYYFSSIAEVVEELMDMKSKELMLKKEDKSIESIHQSIKESKEWLRGEIGRASCRERV